MFNSYRRTVGSDSGHPRRGAILVLAAVLMVILLGMIAFAVDIGSLMLVRTQLQVAADSAAMASGAMISSDPSQAINSAKQFAGYHKVFGRTVSVRDQDIIIGTWDTATRTFTAAGSGGSGNAVRVITRCDSLANGPLPLFFAPVFGMKSAGATASAVAVANPRDICFVVDLSSSMNDDTEPDGVSALNSQFAGQGYPNIGTQLIQAVYDDFGFGAYPGTTQSIGQSIGATSLTNLMNYNGPLKNKGLGDYYTPLKKDSTATCKTKAYRWAMDYQIRQLMPAAKPVPNSATNYAYWADYLDSYYNEMGYKSYVQWMMYYGRDQTVDGTNYTSLSINSPDCPYHTESTPAGNIQFPPREQPTHAARRSVVAAMQIIKDRNQNISDKTQADWVSIVLFDRTSWVELPLTSDYTSVIEKGRKLQACGGSGVCTNTETGLITARNHIKPRSQGGMGRESANKIIVLLTDGAPNLQTTSTTTVNTYVGQNPSSNFYSSGYTAHQAALMQTKQMQGTGWYIYPVGIGLGTDYSFMDRMARMGATASDSGQSPRTAANPLDYESSVTSIFQSIITNPKLRIVQ